MKKVYIVFTVVLLISTISCKKNDKGLSTPDIDQVDARISVVTSNLQTKYGGFTSSATVQGVFKPKINISSFAVGDYSVERKETTMFFGATSMDPVLSKMFPSFYGKALHIKLNGQEITNNHTVPYANAVIFEGGLPNWAISKSKGITIKWTKHGYLTNSSASRSGVSARINNSIDPIVLPPDPNLDEQATVVAIIPDELQYTTGTSQYWVVPQGTTTFTFDPNVLSMYSPYETLTISVTTGANLVVDANDVVTDIVYLNSTILPSVQVLP